jgi:hypothetical protein
MGEDQQQTQGLEPQDKVIVVVLVWGLAHITLAVVVALVALEVMDHLVLQQAGLVDQVLQPRLRDRKRILLAGVVVQQIHLGLLPAALAVEALGLMEATMLLPEVLIRAAVAVAGFQRTVARLAVPA